MEAIYIIIKDMQVINANLSSSYFTCDFSQNACLGFSHNLARFLDEKIPNEEDEDFGDIDTVQLGNEQVFSIIKSLEFYQGHASFVGHLNDNNHKALNIPMNPPEIKGTFKQTLVLKVFIRKYSDISQLRIWIKHFLHLNRFAGGDIQYPNHLDIEVFKDVNHLKTRLQWEKGWVVKDVTERLIKKAQQDNYNTAFCDFLSTFKQIEKSKLKKDDKVTYQKNHKGWFYASLAGYQLLESPKQREGARFGHPHAFAEPIIGLHQLNYFRILDLNNLFWYGHFENNCYLLKQGN